MTPRKTLFAIFIAVPVLISAQSYPTDSLNLIAYDLSDDGKFFVASFYHYTRNKQRIYAWSNETAKLLYTRPGGPTSIVISPAGDVMVTDRSDAVIVWNIKTGAKVDSLVIGKEIRQMQFSPSGKFLVVSLASALKALVVDTKSWEILHAIEGSYSTFSFNADETRLEATTHYTDETGQYSPPELRSMIFEMSTGRFVKATYYASQAFDSIKGFSSMTYDSVVLKGKALFEEMQRRTYATDQCDCGDYYIMVQHPYVVRWDKRKFSQRVLKGLKMASDEYQVHLHCKYFLSDKTVYDISKTHASKIGSVKILDEMYIENIGFFEPYKIRSGVAAVVIHDEAGQNFQSVNIYKFEPEHGEFPGQKVATYRVDMR